jgi:mono/diheme cytochrome c family protein
MKRIFSTLTSFAALALITSALTGCGSDSTSGSSDPVAAGKSAVSKYKCESCHTPPGNIGTLAGATEKYQDTDAYPANLTPDSDTGLGDWDTATIVKAILTGIDDEGESLCSTMPRFGTEGMTETEAENIAAYLKSLPAVKHEVPESECPGKGGGDGG